MLDQQLLVVHSFIHVFTLPFSSTFAGTNATLGAGHTEINNAHPLLPAAHRFCCRVESMMASWQVFQTLWQWFSTVWFNKIRLGTVASDSLVNLLHKNNFPCILLHWEKNDKNPRMGPQTGYSNKELPRCEIPASVTPLMTHLRICRAGTFILNPHSAILLQLLFLLVCYCRSPSVVPTPFSPGCKRRLRTAAESCSYSTAPPHPQQQVEYFENEIANELQFMFMGKRRVRKEEREERKRGLSHLEF